METIGAPACLVFVIALMLAAILLPFGIAMFFWQKREDRQWKKLREEHKRLQEQYLAELDTALEEWLGSLELPQLEERTKRQEAARRLSNLLLAKLMRWRVPERISMVHLPE